MHERGPGLFISIEAGRSPDAERIVRQLTRRVRSNIAQWQRRAGMQRVLSTTVFEALGRDRQPKFGAHIVAVMPNAAARDRLIESLSGSKAYGKHIDARAVTAQGGVCVLGRRDAGPGLRRLSWAAPGGGLGVLDCPEGGGDEIDGGQGGGLDGGRRGRMRSGHERS
jgi:hypothetical protein